MINTQQKHYIQLKAEQRSPEWFGARKSNLTASGFSSVTKILKSGKPSQERETLKYEKASETLTCISYSKAVSPKALDWGAETESYAFNLYKEILAKQGLRLEKSFLSFPSNYERVAASPDGEIYDSDNNLVALLEIKCPNTSTHLQYIEDEQAPSIYHSQMMLQMATFDCDTVHFISFDPRLNGDLSLVIRFFTSTKEDREACLGQCESFINEVKDLEQNVININSNFYDKYCETNNVQRLELLSEINKARSDFINNSIYGKFVENRAEIERETDRTPTFTSLSYYEREEFVKQVSRQEILLEIMHKAKTESDN